MNHEQKLKKAIKMLTEEFEKAEDLEDVCKPMVYALHKVWEFFDKNEKPYLPGLTDEEKAEIREKQWEERQLRIADDRAEGGLWSI